MEKKNGIILLVEDNPNDAKLTMLAIKNSNIENEIVLVKDGVEALDYIFGNIKNLPNLILLDLKMPKISGIEVLRKIKEDSRTKNIPVVVFTSSQEEPDVKECYNLGANSYIVKPLGFDEFSKVVKDTGLYWLSINHLPK